MYYTREQLEKVFKKKDYYIERLLPKGKYKRISDSKKIKKEQEIIYAICQKHNLLLGDVCDMATGRKNIIEFSEFEIFCFLEQILTEEELKEIFTQKEIEIYAKTVIPKDNISFPLVIPNMIEVSKEQQYIGKITFRELKKLSDIIAYNENTQRVMRRIINKDGEKFQVYINKKAINDIKKAFESNIYIPNTLTFNIPESAEIMYDNKQNTLVVKGECKLDIIDGYHRFVAMKILGAIDTNWDYDMEIRITHFSEKKCQQFIYQEDQKTKMSKINSDSYNKESNISKLVYRLNDYGTLRNKIKKNGGIINEATLTAILNYFYKKIDYKTAIDLKNKLDNYFDELQIRDERFTKKPYSVEDLILVIYAFNQCDTFDEAYSKIKDEVKFECKYCEVMTSYSQISKSIKKIKERW